jgi:hypothetical protein
MASISVASTRLLLFSVSFHVSEPYNKLLLIDALVLQDTRFKVVLIRVQVFWDVMPHSKINSYRHSGGI